MTTSEERLRELIPYMSGALARQDMARAADDLHSAVELARAFREEAAIWKRYADHLPTCSLKKEWTAEMSNVVCTCGLDGLRTGKAAS